MLLSAPLSTKAEVTPNGIPDETYPGTTITVQPGDILYSSKTLGGAQPIVGHVGIIAGPYNKVYNAHTTGPQMDTLTYYTGIRHKPDDLITVYRHTEGGGAEAAKWADANLYKMWTYVIDPFGWSDIKNNYCSKFVWQAYYYGANKSVSYLPYPSTPGGLYIPPGEISNSPYTRKVASFKASDYSKAMLNKEVKDEKELQAVTE